MNRIKLFVLAVFAVMSLASGITYAADPSLHEVYQSTAAGNYKQAHAMMDQVLHDHPGSSKAHYVVAELYAKEGRLDAAQAELATAEKLAPGLPFANPEAVTQLRSRIDATSLITPVGKPLPAPGSGISWKLILFASLLVAAIVYFIRSLNRPQVITSASAAYPSTGGGGYAQPVGGGVSPVGPAGGGGMGTGILGGLATGAAVGAGMVAGEVLMHKVLGGSQGHTSQIIDTAPVSVPHSSFDMGGNDFGVSDGGSWDDKSASIGDDW